MKLLISAFDPFGGESINPAMQAVSMMPKKLAGAQIIPIILPTSFSRCFDLLEQAIDAHQPDAVLCLGQAGGRYQITPERVAINCMDADIADNDGFMPVDQPIIPGGPAAYFSTLPIHAITDRLLACQIPAKVSNTAGTFVCNTLMYRLMHLCHTKAPQMRAGFMHVPYTTAQTLDRNAPSLSPVQITLGLMAAAEVVISDVAETGDIK